MNRAELVEAISGATKLSKSDTDRWVSAFVETVTGNIHDDVKLVGFGTFKVVDRQPRVARNPQTGETVQIPARQVPVFKPGSELKSLVRG